jgi:hypothetical protein
MSFKLFRVRRVGVFLKFGRKDFIEVPCPD